MASWIFLSQNLTKLLALLIFPLQLQFLSFDVSNAFTTRTTKYQQESQQGPNLLGSWVPEIQQEKNFPYTKEKKKNYCPTPS